MTETSRIESFAEEELRTGVTRKDILPYKDPIKYVKWLFPDKSIIIINLKGELQAIGEIDFNSTYMYNDEYKFGLKEINSLAKTWKSISISNEEENTKQNAYSFIKHKIIENRNLKVEEKNVVDELHGLVGDRKCAIDVQYPFRLNIRVDDLNYCYGFQCNVRFKCTPDQYKRELYHDIEEVLGSYLELLNESHDIGDFKKGINEYDELDEVEITKNTESEIVSYSLKIIIRKKLRFTKFGR